MQLRDGVASTLQLRSEHFRVAIDLSGLIDLRILSDTVPARR